MPASSPVAWRDPAAARRAWLWLLALLLLWPACRISEFQPWLLFAPDSAPPLAGFVSGFWPPAHDALFLAEAGRALLQTLAMATVGLLLAIVIGAPLALLASRALSLTALTGRRPAWPTQALRAAVRGLLLLLRGVPEVVWALLFVRSVGLGSLAAVLAIGLAYGGMLGKVYAEILESQPTGPAAGLAAAGSGRLGLFCYALWPQALPELVSYTVYRWECAIRASAVMGLVGAGGLGQLLDSSIKLLNSGEVATLLLLFFLLVLLTEAISRSSRWALTVHSGGWGLLLLGLLALLASGWLLLPDWPLSQLTDLPASLRAFAADFLPPAHDAARLQQVAQGSLQTLAMSALGSGLALLAAAALAPLAADAAQSRRLLRWLTRGVLNTLRGIPDLLWAVLMVLAVGLGPFAGTLALALHTSGVLGRLFAETLENADRRPQLALRAAGASRLAAFLYGALPQVWPQWLAYALYRWENNIRMAAVLGVVGAGGLGQQLYLALSLFHSKQAATVLLAMLLLSWLVEQLSAVLRRRWS